jgi:hypothetical protein
MPAPSGGLKVAGLKVVVVLFYFFFTSSYRDELLSPLS